MLDVCEVGAERAGCAGREGSGGPDERNARGVRDVIKGRAG